jgi:RNA polymerase sigma-70 factor (ECF subfamily)
MTRQWLANAATYADVYRALLGAGASPDAAADAVQDAYVRALELTEAPTNPGGWMFVVALRHWKRARWRARLLGPLRAATAAAPNSEQSRVEAIDAVRAVRALPTREREVVVARYLLGLSQVETAARLGISPGTVAATTHHATEKLREWLKLDDQ